jgi:hypothetical protein
MHAAVGLEEQPDGVRVARFLAIRGLRVTPSDALNVTSVSDAEALPASSFAEVPQADSTSAQSATRAKLWSRPCSLRRKESDSKCDHSDRGRRSCGHSDRGHRPRDRGINRLERIRGCVSSSKLLHETRLRRLDSSACRSI